jgi:hypothetical protein
MGYTITIGQLSIEKNPDDGLDCSCVRFDAEGARHDDAPAFGEPTDYTNSRWPSYGVWADFMRATGLYDVFFYDSGHLIGGHPGVRLITPDLALKVSHALVEYRQANPSAEPILRDVDDASAWLCRLIWLDYWIAWAIKNCETPVIANS